MAITAIKFGDGSPLYMDTSAGVLGVRCDYYKAGEGIIQSKRTLGVRLSSIRPNAQSAEDPETTIELLTLSNGMKIVLEYRLYTSDYTGGVSYIMKARIKLLNLRDEEVTGRSVGPIAVNKPITAVRTPFEDIYINLGTLSFSDKPTTTESHPTSFNFMTLYYENPIQLVPHDFNGDGNRSDLTSTWFELVSAFVANSDADYQRLLDMLKAGGDGSDPITPDEPVPEGGPAGSEDTSKPGGGGGNYDDSSDPIDFPDIPTGGALESGAIIAHRVSKQTLEAILRKLWTKSIFDIPTMWQKSLEDPMDAIVSLHALPISPEVVQDPNNIFIGNLDMDVKAPVVVSQYVEVDCGSLTVKEFWGSALDYSPYTRVEIYLPFIGIQTLRTEDIVNSTIHIKYYIDVLTGDCIAFIKCGISVLYTFNGNCRMSIPLSSRSTDFLQKVAVAAGLAVGAVGVSVGGGAALAGATKAPQIASASVAATAADIQSDSMAISSASNIASTKINTSRSGDMSGSLSLMSYYKPYFIIHRPIQSLAKDYNKFKGYTSNITKILGSLSGFTEVEHINLQGIPNATAAEMAEIKTALRNGVIF